MGRQSLKTFKRSATKLFTAGALTLGSLYCGGKSDPVAPPTSQKPIASFTVNPKEGYAPLVTCFDGSSSRAPESAISRFIWSFGDGSEDSNSGMNVCHTYATPGNYSPGLTVESMRGERSPQTLDQIVAKDGSPSINISNLSGREDITLILDLNGKVTSPIYDASKLKITAISPDLDITFYGNDSLMVKNKVKDWNGSTYIDFGVEDPDKRKVIQRVNANFAPQTDVKGFLEHVLTGARIPGITIYNKSGNVMSNAQGEFSFQAEQNDSLFIDSPQHYKVKMPLTVNGQDVDLGNVQMIDRYTDPINGDDLLTFIKTYMLPSRWDDADLPIKVYIDNNPPSAEYREAVRKGVMDLWQPVVDMWLPSTRRIILTQIINFDPFSVATSGIKIEYTSPDTPWYNGNFKNGVIGMNPNQGVNSVSQSVAHEFGHELGLVHVPYLDYIMCAACPALPSKFEGLAVATKYKLKKDATAFYEK